MKLSSKIIRGRSGIAAALLGSTLVLPSCAVGPDYKKPESRVPENWHQTLEGGAVAGQPADLARWWTTLNDPALDGLIERAVKGNHDLRIASARLREARAQRGVVAADQYPTVNVDGSYTRERTSDNIASGFGSNGETDDYQVGFDAAWEIDIWGRVRRNVEAADADLGAAEESRRDVLITLLAEVARNYVELRSLQERVAIAQANTLSQQQTLDLSKARFKAGLSSDLDVARAESQLNLTKSQVPALNALTQASIHRLGVLVGQEPGAMAQELELVKALPVKPAQVPVGLPSDLLRRRPDIRQAERALAAATARIGVAEGDLFPRFSLTGSFGFESDNVGRLFEGNSRFWAIGPAVRWPIFDAGRIRNNVKVQNARQEQAVALYEKVILTSLEDVENSLVSYAREQDRRQALVDSESSAKRATDLATELYSRGLTDFLSVLEAQRQLFAAQDLRAQSDRTVLTDLIALYKSLGGEWDQDKAAAEGSATTELGKS